MKFMKLSYLLKREGYLMVKNEIEKINFYWCCEKRKSEDCRSWAITIYSIAHITLANLKASSAKVAKVIVQIRFENKKKYW